MFKRKITELLTATTTDLGIWLNEKMVFKDYQNKCIASL